MKQSNNQSIQFLHQHQYRNASTDSSLKKKRDSKFYTFCQTQFPNKFKVGERDIVEELFSSESQKLCFSEISKRSIITVEGEHSDSFIHSLVTSDVSKKLIVRDEKKKTLPSHNSQPAMFLSPKGRVIFDAILSVEFESDGSLKNNRKIYIEHDASQTENLYNHLKSHILRKKVKIEKYSANFQSSSEERPIVKVFALFGNKILKSRKPDLQYKWKDSVVCVKDPRIPTLGYRIYGFFTNQEQYEQFKHDVSEELSKKLLIDTESAEYYERIRLLSGIAENSVDIPSESAFPMESGFEQIGGIHFDKGCYIGQELTNRTYHRGEIRKRIVIIKGDKLPQAGTDLQFTGPNTEELRSDKAGRMCSSDEQVGLATVKFEPLLEKDSTLKLSFESDGNANNTLEIVPPYWLSL